MSPRVPQAPGWAPGGEEGHGFLCLVPPRDATQSAHTRPRSHSISSRTPYACTPPPPPRFNNLTSDAFSFRLEYNTSTRHGLPPGHTTGPVIAQFEVSGVMDAITR